MAGNTDLDTHQQFQLISLRQQIKTFDREDLEELFISCWTLSLKRNNLICQLLLSSWGMTDTEAIRHATEIIDD